MSPIYKDIFAFFDSTISGWALARAGQAASAIAPVTWTCLGIYVVLYAIMLMQGRIREYVLDGALRIIKFTLILSIAFNMAQYGGWFVDIFTKGPEELAKAILPAAPSSSVNILDKALDDGMQVAGTIWEASGKFDLRILAAILVFVVTIVLTGAAAAIMIIGKVGTALLLAVGPIFIVFLLFESTKRFFEGWLGYLVTLALYAIFAGLCIQFLMKLFATYSMIAAGAVGNPKFGLKDLAGMAISSVICGLVLKQIPNMSSSLGGGVSISTAGAVSWALGKFNRAGEAAARNTYRGGKYAVVKGGGWAARQGVAFWRKHRNNSIRKD